MTPRSGHTKKKVIDGILRALDEADAAGLNPFADRNDDSSAVQAVRDAGLGFGAHSVRRWTRIARSLRGEINVPAKRLFDQLADRDESGALVVKVLQRGTFTSMDCVEKVVCFRSLAMRADYVVSKGVSSGAWTPEPSESFLMFVKELVSKVRGTDVGARFTMTDWCRDGGGRGGRDVAGLVAKLIKKESFTSSGTGRYNEAALLTWVWRKLQPELSKYCTEQPPSAQDDGRVFSNSEEVLDGDGEPMEIVPSNKRNALNLLNEVHPPFEKIKLVHRISPVKGEEELENGLRAGPVRTLGPSKDKETSKGVGMCAKHSGSSAPFVPTRRSSPRGISCPEKVQHVHTPSKNVQNRNASVSPNSPTVPQGDPDLGKKATTIQSALAESPSTSAKKRKVKLMGEEEFRRSAGLVVSPKRNKVGKKSSAKCPVRFRRKQATGAAIINPSVAGGPSAQAAELVSTQPHTSVPVPRFRPQLPRVIRCMAMIEKADDIYNEYSEFQDQVAKRHDIKAVLSDKVDLSMDLNASFHTVMDLAFPLRPYSPLFHFMRKRDFDMVIAAVPMACRRAERKRCELAVQERPRSVFHELNGIPGFQEIIYLRTCSTVLESRGYTLLPSIFLGGGSEMNISAKVDILFSYLETLYARNDAHPSNVPVPKNEEDQAVWNYSHRRDEALSGDIDEGLAVNGRVITCSGALCRSLIHRDREVLIAKLAVELFVAKLLSSFTIKTLIHDSPLVMPNRGARFAMSSPDFTFRECGTFGAVIDSGQPLVLSISGDDDVPLCHSVMAIFTGSTPTWIRVWPGSHKISAMAPSNMKTTLERACLSTCLCIPPYSVLYLRGDVLWTEVSSETRLLMAKSGIFSHAKYNDGITLDSSYKKTGSKFMEIHGSLSFIRPGMKIYNRRFPVHSQQWELNDEFVDFSEASVVEDAQLTTVGDVQLTTIE